MTKLMAVGSALVVKTVRQIEKDEVTYCDFSLNQIT
jgi:hypothetical protein